MQAIEGLVTLANSLVEVAQCSGASSRIFEILQTRHFEIYDKRQMAFLMDRSQPRAPQVNGKQKRQRKRLLVRQIQQQQQQQQPEQQQQQPEQQRVFFDVSQFDGSLCFRDVAFRYHPHGRLILNHLNFEVESGSTVALVGASGGGKSTIVYLIEGLYTASGGDILIGGKNIKDLDLTWMRQNLVTIVGQEPSLFAGTIRTNITYGRPDASDAQVEEAARLANAHDFILKLDGGYDACVGERGVMLSGGQKQRIAIARALLVDAKIMLLDEATSALDAESERLVQQTLEKVIADTGRTVIVIAHRLSTVRRANKIMVLDRGGIAESGDHESLMKINAGIYRKLVEGQMTFT